ncbi:PAP/fibrillin family protein [Thermosynechococcaceae cyanobacterium BACA0444]|uniref:PAP/fibrillin family protein n=1 Tax=Pseudocalidococcus azoricus BACA0444 TaxID=2918990 RepID=A0AAE4FQF2_9CYAN|nr:PAP/fibrillin family protein [Pseudocalidococcus azoricus]MDS3860328.1 PAP/fibrillin family protein [Pseudocalidococcus azoricus BACA0444]
MPKAALLTAIAGLNRGILANPTEKKRVDELAQGLEAVNPTPDLLQAPDKLAGNWRLIYTSSQALLGLDRAPLVKLGQIYQCVRPAEQAIFNIAELYGLPYLEGLVSVVAKFEPIPDAPARVRVKFQRSIIGLRQLLNYRSPEQFISQLASGKTLMGLDFKLNSEEQQGWLDITYLDDDLRLGRGNEGSLFVLSKS